MTLHRYARFRQGFDEGEAELAHDGIGTGLHGGLGIMALQRYGLFEHPLREGVGDGGCAGFRSAVVAATGLEPVSEPLASARQRDVTMLWLGPDEWLVVTPDRRVAGIERALRDALEGQRAALTDVSHGRTVLALSGPEARTVLAKGCPLDLHPRVFGPGRCAQSRLAKCQVLIHQTHVAPTFEIYVNRSFSQYAWTWLEDAAREFGVRVVSAQ